jgi:hypothetical protein
MNNRLRETESKPIVDRVDAALATTILLFIAIYLANDETMEVAFKIKGRRAIRSNG